ncbi:130aa long hypothetical protein [Pyrococcus horikoshii OT3]|uniref:Uncharacterized protein n=1 Tax=Pyrococcus horikoshii (strain ATCC 700860 / DSM 12428 / JCM 9974 / NBRC 100139 / OT-3) TaxID=70601 RepID=O59275_PYRHO|nr:130aa long hypothetical protein [Pyrococcus horikoshii OT3]
MKALALSTKFEPKTPLSSSSLSWAIIEVPSIPAPFVRIIASPGLGFGTTRFSFSTSPSIVPTTIGFFNPGVTSVWPPTIDIPIPSATSRTSSIMVMTSLNSEPSGSSIVTKNHFGLAPKVATSFAFILTA